MCNASNSDWHAIREPPVKRPRTPNQFPMPLEIIMGLLGHNEMVKKIASSHPSRSHLIKKTKKAEAPQGL